MYYLSIFPIPPEIQFRESALHSLTRNGNKDALCWMQDSSKGQVVLLWVYTHEKKREWFKIIDLNIFSSIGVGMDGFMSLSDDKMIGIETFLFVSLRYKNEKKITLENNRTSARRDLEV